jgi:ubiquinone/menaquinone biosynthesis C-methylase UbiE
MDLSSFPDNTFDILHAHALIIHLKDPVSAYKEFYRVLKPGGIVASREMNPHAILSLKPDLAPLRQYWDRVVTFMPALGMNPDTSSKMEEWVKEAGFGGEGKKLLVSKSRIYSATHLTAVTGERAAMVLQYKFGTEEDMARWKNAWETWEATDGAEFVHETTEILGWK